MSDQKWIAMSFDDGPNTKITPQVLDLLEKYGVVATFFVEGQYITEETIPVMKRALSLGCRYENHSFSHQQMAEMDAELIAREIRETDERIIAVTGRKPLFFRPPFISVSEKLFASVDKTFICGFDAEDWVPMVSAEERAKRILSKARTGGITLLHDMEGNDKTVEALDTIIPALLAEGYKFVTVEEIFRLMQITPKKGTLYSYAE